MIYTRSRLHEFIDQLPTGHIVFVINRSMCIILFIAIGHIRLCTYLNNSWPPTNATISACVLHGVIELNTILSFLISLHHRPAMHFKLCDTMAASLVNLSSFLSVTLFPSFHLTYTVLLLLFRDVLCHFNHNYILIFIVAFNIVAYDGTRPWPCRHLHTSSIYRTVIVRRIWNVYWLTDRLSVITRRHAVTAIYQLWVQGMGIHPLDQPL